MKLKNLVLLAVFLPALTGCPTLQIAPYDAADASETLPVAMVSMECSTDPDVNRAAMEDYITKIMEDHPDTKLICFGETIIGWYWKPGESKEYHERIAEPLDGATVTLMKNLALENDIYISFGFTEADGTDVYNSAVILDDAGEIIAHRRKSDFVPMDCFSGFTRGEKEITTAYIDGIKAAFLICNDFNNASYQKQINSDPDIKMLLLPHATANLEPDFWEHYKYNFEGLWMLSAQRYGTENNLSYYGSWILDPNGYMTAFSETGAGYFYYEIPID